MRIKFLQDTECPWGEAKEGAVIDVERGLAKQLVLLKLAVPTETLAIGEADAIEHAEKTKGDGTIIVVASPQELQAMMQSENEEESMAESGPTRRKSRKQ